MKKYDTIIFILVIAIIGIIGYIFLSNRNLLIEEINIEEDMVSIYVREEYRLKVNVVPKDASKKNIKWTSSDPSIALVDENGIVNAISEGQTNIIASTNDGSISDSCIVSVKVREIERIEIGNPTIILRKGETKEINAVVYPFNVTDSTLIYQSSDESILTVDGNGRVTGIKDGTVEVIVSDPRKKVVEKVKIIVGIPLERIAINKNSVSIYIGKVETLSAVYTPENTTIRSVTWSSSNPSVVMVDQNGKITGKGVGEGIITLTSIDTGKKATCRVKVAKEPIRVQSIKLDKESVNLDIGKKVELKTIITPSNADNKEISWTSSDNNIATVDQNGIITAKDGGTVTITATNKYSGKKATCKVIVKPKIASPIVPSSYSQKYEGSTFKYYIQNNNGYYLTYIWMEDPYNQIRKIESTVAQYGKVMTDAELEAEGKRPLRMDVGSMMNAYIRQGRIPKGNAAVAYNASSFFYVGGAPSKFYENRSLSWFVITDGRIIRNRVTETDFGNEACHVIGINPNGDLKMYRDFDGVEGRRTSSKLMLEQNFKNTWSFYPFLIKDGYRYDNVDDVKFALRNGICQLNSNNYIMFTSTYSRTIDDLSRKLYDLGCKQAFNLDGGGSTSFFVKNPGDTFVQKIKCSEGQNCRPIVEGIYFTDK